MLRLKLPCFDKEDTASERMHWQVSSLALLRQAGIIADTAPLRCWRSRSSFYEEVFCKFYSQPHRLFIFAPNIRWHADLIQRCHHFARALSALGHTVVYFTASNKDKIGYANIAPQLYVTSDIDMLRDVEDNYIYISSTSWRTNILDICTWRRRNNVVIYDYIDCIDELITGTRTQSSRQLFAGISSAVIDVAMASAKVLCHELTEKVAPKRAVYVPNGVDSVFYELSRQIDLCPPPELALHVDSGRVLIGYFGAIAPWLWYDLICEVAARRRDWLFIFIGPPYQSSIDNLPMSENILRIPQVDYRLIPQYGRWFDVAMIPFAPGAIARATSPLKLFEYLALGKPVVASADLVECLDAPCVFPFESPNGFLEACEQALAEANFSPRFSAECRKAAAEADWRSRARIFESL